MKTIVCALLAAACLGMSSCGQRTLAPDAISTSLSTEVDGTVASRVFDGLRASMPPRSRSGRQLRVLVVNGMATNAHGYSFALQKRIAARLGVPTCRQDRVVRLQRPAFVSDRVENGRMVFPPSSLRITSWASSNTTDAGLTVYELLWTPYSDALTDFLVAPYETGATFTVSPRWKYCGGKIKSPPNRTRVSPTAKAAALNEFLKNRLILAGVADAAMTVGPLGAAARDAVRQGFCFMIGDTLNDPMTDNGSARCSLSQNTLSRHGGTHAIETKLRRESFAVLTYSLGSFLFLDAIDEFRLWPNDLGPAKQACRLFPAVLDQMPVYMFSNQISLLMLSHPHFGCSGSSCALYGEFGGRRTLLADPRDRGEISRPRGQCQETASLDLVAFNDPNDVMGYNIPDYLLETPLVGSVTNVRVRNRAISIPGLVSDPLAAHSGHGDNSAIIEFLVNGWSDE